MTHVLLTIGLNELPTLVAAYRLYAHYHNSGQLPIRFSAICSINTAKDGEEADRVKKHLLKKLRQEKMIEPDEDIDWRKVIVEEYHPKNIKTKVGEVIAKDASALFHLHHTGGTKAMGVHSMEAIKNAGVDYEVSYLSPDEHCLYDGNDQIIDLAAGRDERDEWRLDVTDLGDLHGFSSIPHWHPTDRELQLGSAILEIIKDKKINEGFRDWLDKQGKRQQPSDWPSVFPNEIISELKSVYCRREDWKGRDAPGWKFLNGRPLECAANLSLKQVANLEGTRIGSDFECRKQHAGWHSRFQLDVVAVFGYELLLVSCSLASGNEKIKQKGFEATHRARQIGGSNARAIVLTVAPKAEKDTAQTTLIDDLGGRKNVVEVWGRAEVDQLQEEFAKYLDRIKWRKL